MKQFALILVTISVISCNVNKKQSHILPSENPPGGLTVSETPQFIVFGFDDNGYSGYGFKPKQGISFLLETFDSFTNPKGNQNPKTFDGKQAKFSFYCNGRYIVNASKIDSIPHVKEAWTIAIKNGHDLGNHTYSHKHGKNENFTKAMWIEEMSLCRNIFKQITTQKELGFRTPFLGYNQATFEAVQEYGFTYDCSLLSGSNAKRNGTNSLWPFTLPKGVEINDEIDEYLVSNSHSEFTEIIELPISYILIPPDSLCEKYGIEKGLLKKAKENSAYYTGNGKIPGLDWNMFSDFGFETKEALACIKYTIDLRINGNRAPLFLCFHGDMYVDNYDVYDTPPHKNTTAKQRREFLQELFILLNDYEEIRVVNSKDFIDWFKSPSAL